MWKADNSQEMLSLIFSEKKKKKKDKILFATTFLGA